MSTEIKPPSLPSGSIMEDVVVLAQYRHAAVELLNTVETALLPIS